MTKHFKLTPISDPPKEDGWYHMYVVQPNTHAVSVDRWWDSEQGWQDVPESYTHYLAPLAEQVEGIRWVKANEFKFIGRKTYCAKFHTNDGKEELRGSGWFQISDGVFFWHNQGYIPIERALHHQLFILDDSVSSTPSAREAELERECEGLRKELAELHELISTNGISH